jgi:hypothetical protein
LRPADSLAGGRAGQRVYDVADPRQFVALAGKICDLSRFAGMALPGLSKTFRVAAMTVRKNDHEGVYVKMLAWLSLECY